MKNTCLCTAVLLLVLTVSTLADGPRDNIPDNVRQVPPVGIELSEADRTRIEAGLAQLDEAIRSLKKRRDARTHRFLPDVEIFSRAAHQGVTFRELYSKRDTGSVGRILEEGLQRAASLLAGKTPWTTQTGLVVRGFRSEIDDTVQPYGLVIPESYTFSGNSRYRLDLWFHGRGERTGEVQFIAQRMSQVGRISPQDTIVLHPYGRYSNAFKFAGEIDVLEALEHAQQNYRVDDDRIAVRGFSMGGAGCWQMAVHYPDLFFAASPGAGFSETPEFLKFFQKETLHPTWYEKKLWQMYDCNGYVANLHQLPTVAYSGENDIQKQAADLMEAAAEAEGLRLTHLIGPDTGHGIHRDSLVEIERRLAHLAERGRRKVPSQIHFATFTLKYNRMHWLTVTGLGEHWAPVRVDAKIDRRRNTVVVDTENVTGLQLNFAPGRNPFALNSDVTVLIDGQTIQGGRPSTSHDWSCELHRVKTAWQFGPAKNNGLRKTHNLQGPIDDAFMDTFLVVRPTGVSRHAAVDKWARSELDHLTTQWRQQFRGDARITDDTDISQEDIQRSNLVLFGDPDSNSVIGKLIPHLPIGWTGSTVDVQDRSYAAGHHVPVLIYPNPLNPRRYVVLNSGFTYREFAYLNNARQVPKLPDWAIIDVRTPADSLWPGKVVAADFFDEFWQLKPSRQVREAVGQTAPGIKRRGFHFPGARTSMAPASASAGLKRISRSMPQATTASHGQFRKGPVILKSVPASTSRD